MIFKNILIILPFLFLITSCNKKQFKLNQNLNFRNIKSVDYPLVDRYIFKPNCVSCHGDAGGINLESYANVKAVLPEIKRAIFEAKTMPKNGALDPILAQVLQRWIDQGAPEGGAPAPTPMLEARYSSIRDNIFTPRCTSCHSPNGTAKNVILDNYGPLINSPRDLVLPGNLEESGLWIAVTRTDDKQMPPTKDGGRKLNEEELGAIRQWITDGAKND